MEALLLAEGLKEFYRSSRVGAKLILPSAARIFMEDFQLLRNMVVVVLWLYRKVKVIGVG
jgi:hypothetical protein